MAKWPGIYFIRDWVGLGAYLNGFAKSRPYRSWTAGPPSPLCTTAHSTPLQHAAMSLHRVICDLLIQLYALCFYYQQLSALQENESHSQRSSAAAWKVRRAADAIREDFEFRTGEKVSCLLFYSSNIIAIGNYSTGRSHWVLSQSSQEWPSNSVVFSMPVH